MAGQIILAIRRGDERREHPLTAGTVTIGRAPENTVVLDDRDVSAHHARIECVDGGLCLTDLGSKCSTRLNEVTLSPHTPCRFTEGKHAQIGPFVLSLHGATALAQTETIVAVPGFAGESTIVDAPPPPPGIVSAAGDARATVLLRPQSRLIVIVTTPEGTTECPLVEEVVTIGRDTTNDIVIEERDVSRRHAALRRLDDTYEIVDLGAGNGLTFDGRRIERRRLTDGDRIALSGAVSVMYRAQPDPVEAASSVRRIDLRGRGHLLIGRLAENDLVLNHPAVSRFHARISRRDDGYILEDLDAANGTFVNGARVSAGAAHSLHSGDTIRIGAVKLVIHEDALEQVDESRDLRLDALHLNQPVGKGINLLQDISLTVHPREFVAVVGVSGAGKSTLLGALIGFQPAREGSVLVNGSDLYGNFDAYRTSLGYVPQDDIIHLDLPVERALAYAARLRLPADTTGEERRQRVEEVMAVLNLTERRAVPVRDLSGGQRKRVSIGVELLTKPGLFFLDEATSGLDPGTELQLMRLLRRLADEGQTVLLVTHATKRVALCDQVVFLAKGGHLAWYGPPDEALRYFDVEDFDAIYEKLESELTPAEWARHYRDSQAYQRYVAGRLVVRYGPDERAWGGDPVPHPSTPPSPAGRPLHTGNASAFRQFLVLCARYLDIIRRDRVGLLLLFLVPLLLGAIDLLAWPRDILDPVTGTADRTMTMLFLGTVIPFLLGGLGSAREIVKESRIYRRERMATLRIVPYVLSKVWVALLFSLYNAAVLLGFKLLAVDLSSIGGDGITKLYITLALLSMSGAMWGLLLSALARREDQVMMLVVLVVVVQIVFSGGILPLRNLGPAGQVLGAVTSSRWAFEAEVAAIQVKRGDCDGPGLQSCHLPGIDRLQSDAERRVLVAQLDDRFRDSFGRRLTTSWTAMLAIIAVLFAAIVILQKRKDTT